MFAAKELLSSACRLPPGCLKSIRRPEAGSLLEITKGKDFLKNGMLYAVISGGQRSAAIKLSPSPIEERGTNTCCS
jgi:hypothetical protein